MDNTRRRPGRRPQQARPDHAPGPRQPGPVPQHLAGAFEFELPGIGPFGTASSRTSRRATGCGRSPSSSGKVWKAWTERPRARGSMRMWLIGGGGHPVGGREAVEEPAGRGVEGHLVAEVGEDLGVDPLDLEAGLVLERPPGPQGRRAFVADRRVEQNAGLGQGRLGSGRTSVSRTAPERKMTACPPSMIRTSASQFPARPVRNAGRRTSRDGSSG